MGTLALKLHKLILEGFSIAAPCLLWFAPIAAQGEISPLKTEIGGQISELISNKCPESGCKLNFKGIGGTFSYRFTPQTALLASNIADGVSLFKGKPIPGIGRARSNRGAALDIQKNIITIHVISPRHGRLLRIEGDLGVQKKSGRIPATIFLSPRASALACGSPVAAEPTESVKALTESLPAITHAALPSFSLVAEADYDFYRNFKGTNTTKKRAVQLAKAQMASILNAADSIYMDQLGISFRVEKLIVDTDYTDAFNSTKSERVLKSFRSMSLSKKVGSKFDAYHLFSGIRYSGSVVGLAYLGVLCQRQNGNFAFGLTGEASSSIRAFVTAHELGHNMGATHISTPTSIMSVYLGPNNNEFIPASQTEINNYLSANGSCLR